MFGTLKDGRQVERLTISAGDLSISILTLGAIIQDARLSGVPYSLTHGSDDVSDYEGSMLYHGCIAGPVANRIANAEAEVDGRAIRLESNEGTTCLHGGPGGTHGRIWKVVSQTEDSATLRLRLSDGDGGFPGNREMTAEFSISAPSVLTLTLTTTTDAPTLVNLTNHSYWALGGADRHEQTFTCLADRFVEVGEGLIPTGRTPSVEGTLYDFRSGAPVGAGLYDICLCLSDERREMTEVARLEGGGLTLRLDSTEPGLQIYDGGRPGALAIEAQNWSGAANQPAFPSDTLHPGKALVQKTRWTFTRT